MDHLDLLKAKMIGYTFTKYRGFVTGCRTESCDGLAKQAGLKTVPVANANGDAGKQVAENNQGKICANLR
jgi:hypothetical protein